MKYHPAYRIGPSNTPMALKIIIGITIITSLASALISYFTPHDYLYNILGLSFEGIRHGFIWQFFTYSFIQPGYGLNLGFLIHLIFNMYLLWIIGAIIAEKSSTFQLVLLYFLSTILSGIVMFIVMLLGSHHFIYAGATIPVYTILTAWMVLFPDETKLYLFVTIPVKIKWLVLGIIGFNLIVNISNLEFISFFGILSAFIIGYLYAVMIWFKHSPFKFMEKFESKLIFFSRSKVEKLKRKNKD